MLNKMLNKEVVVENSEHQWKRLATLPKLYHYPNSPVLVWMRTPL